VVPLIWETSDQCLAVEWVLEVACISQPQVVLEASIPVNSLACLWAAWVAEAAVVWKTYLEQWVVLVEDVEASKPAECPALHVVVAAEAEEEVEVSRTWEE